MRRFEILEHVGLHAKRLEAPEARLERAFAALWKDEQSAERRVDPLLACLIGRVPTQEEATIAATIIQWLGSNCGRCLVISAFDKAKDPRPDSTPATESGAKS